MEAFWLLWIFVLIEYKVDLTTKRSKQVLNIIISPEKNQKCTLITINKCAACKHYFHSDTTHNMSRRQNLQNWKYNAQLNVSHCLLSWWCSDQKELKLKRNTKKLWTFQKVYFFLEKIRNKLVRDVARAWS